MIKTTGKSTIILIIILILSLLPERAAAQKDEPPKARWQDVALINAARNGNVARMRKLLAAGANANSRTDEHLGSAIYSALLMGETEAVRLLISHGAKLISNSGDEASYFLLSAIILGHYEIAQHLIAQGVKINVSDHTYNMGTVLMQGARFNFDADKYYQLVKSLIAAGANVNLKFEEEWTPLLYAANFDDHRIIKLLLNAKAKVNSVNRQGQNALHFAVLKGDPETVRTLIAAGVNVHQKDEDGMTPLLVAAKVGNPEVIKVLLSAGADAKTVNSDNQTVLTIAAIHGNTEAVQVLVAAGVDINAIDNNGATACNYATGAKFIEIVHILKNVNGLCSSVSLPLLNDEENYQQAFFNAVQIQDIARVELLLAAGADPNSQENYSSLLSAAQDNNSTLIKVLLSAGAKISHNPDLGNPILMELVDDIDHKPSIVKQLITAGAPVNARTADGETALLTAVAINGCCPETVDILIKAGADINAKTTTGENALMRAISGLSGSDNIVYGIAGLNNVVKMYRSLIAAGINVNTQNDEGNTALMMATQAFDFGDTRLVKLLLAAGADANLKNNEGMTALDYAIDSGDIDLIELLAPVTNLKTRSNTSSSVIIKLMNSNKISSSDFHQQITLESIALLIAAGADINAPDPENGLTPLMMAAGNDDQLVVKYLLKKGALIDLEDHKGNTVFDHAASSAIEKLLKNRKH